MKLTLLDRQHPQPQDQHGVELETSAAVAFALDHDRIHRIRYYRIAAFLHKKIHTENLNDSCLVDWFGVFFFFLFQLTKTKICTNNYTFTWSCVVYLLFSYNICSLLVFIFLLVHWNIFVNATAPVNEKERKMTKLMSVSTWPITKKKKNLICRLNHTLCVMKHGFSSGCLRFEERHSTGNFFFLLFFQHYSNTTRKKEAFIEGVVWCSFSSLSAFRL